MQVVEQSPVTFSGSCTDDLLLSKLHLANELAKYQTQYPRIYVLGSWYGNLAPILAKSGIKFNKLYNVDVNPDVKEKSNMVAAHFNINGLVEHLTGDCNKINYKAPSLIVNTSCQDIKGNNWFKRIPKGTVVALQGRNNVSNEYKNLDEFNLVFPLSKTISLNEITLEDPEVSYQRYTKLGIK
jgi:hypothetical protein